MPWVFHHSGRPIKAKRFYATWHDACKKAEVRNAIPHDLRRAASTRFIRSGMPEVVAMTITGHKTPSTFRRYNIIREVEQDEALAKVAALGK